MEPSSLELKLVPRTGFFIVSTSDCSYCKKAKNFLDEQGIMFYELNLDYVDSDIKEFFKEKYKTVPVVYFAGKLIGGYTELLARFQDIHRPDSLIVQKLNPHAILPVRANDTDAGADLFAYLGLTGVVAIEPNERMVIPTGVAMTAPNNHYIRIAPRSGLAAKSGIDVMAGVIDRGYTGEIGVILVNHSNKRFVIRNGDKIAQAIVERVAYSNIIEVKELAPSSRGTDGFGSTG